MYVPPLSSIKLQKHLLPPICSRSMAHWHLASSEKATHLLQAKTYASNCPGEMGVATAFRWGKAARKDCFQRIVEANLRKRKGL